MGREGEAKGLIGGVESVVGRAGVGNALEGPAGVEAEVVPWAVVEALRTLVHVYQAEMSFISSGTSSRLALPTYAAVAFGTQAEAFGAATVIGAFRVEALPFARAVQSTLVHI